MILEADPSASYAGIKTSNVVDFLLQLTKPVQNVSVLGSVSSSPVDDS